MRTLTWNLRTLGRKWFANNAPTSEKALDLTLHELGHELDGDHLSRGYSDALTKLGARTVRLALDDPGFFEPYQVKGQ